MSDIEEIKKERDSLKEELKIAYKLVDERDKILALFECPAHGKCVPWAISEIRNMKFHLRHLKDIEDIKLKLQINVQRLIVEYREEKSDSKYCIENIWKLL